MILLGIPSEATGGRQKGTGVHKLHMLYTHNPRRGYVANEDDVGVDSGGDDDGGTVDFGRFYAGGRDAGMGGWRWTATASSAGQWFVIAVQPTRRRIDGKSDRGKPAVRRQVNAAVESSGEVRAGFLTANSMLVLANCE